MNRNSDPHFNLADALSEDVLDASAERIVAEAAREGAAVAAFDRIVTRAERQARWRRFSGHLLAFVSSLVPRAAWRPALVAVAGVAVVVVAGDLYVHLRPYGAASPPPAAAIPDSAATRGSIAHRNRLAYSEERGGDVGNGAPAVSASVAQPAKIPDALPASPAAVPAPAVAAPAPPAAAEEPPPKRVRTVEIRSSDSAAPPTSADLLSMTPAERKQARADYEQAQRIYSTIAREKAAAPQPPSRAATAPAPKPAVAVAAVPGPTAESDDNLSFDWPLRGRLIRHLGSSADGAPDPGIDIAAPAGTDIRAAEAGVVVYAGNELKTYGNMILVRHSGGFVTAYAHASKLMVKVNDPVRRGQVIAKSGQTGSVTSPQLHFEMRKGATSVDPLQYLPKG